MGIEKPHPKNVAGPFYVVDGCCLACGVPDALAPSLFAFDAKSHCYVRRQPSTADEMQAALQVVRSQEAGCIRYRGTNEIILRRLADAGEAVQCDVAPPEGVLRDHVAFTAKTPEVRTWSGAAVLQNFSEHLLHCPHLRYRTTPIVEAAHEAQFSISWYGDDFHRLAIRSLPDAESQWLIWHADKVGLSELVDRWLKHSALFDGVRWYTAEQWGGSKVWQDQPW